MFTAAGTPPPSAELSKYFNGPIESSPFTVCPKCNALKPFRCHHCSICNKCVLRMDHHCVWMCNDIGVGNVRFFVCFLVSFAISLLLAFVVTAPLNLKLSLSIKLLMTLEAVLGVGIGIFSFFHVIFVLTNQTSLEVADNIRDYFLRPKNERKFITPYDLGIAKNVKQILRFNKWWELFNPFAKQVDINQLDVIISRKFMEYTDFLDDEEEDENNGIVNH
ncbi:zinc finger protein DHHC domain containing protein, putative [Entamoeba invadens IP1]|uniref:Palmitoyltransferase n=1 Tax=Entamoeba invadens IP1 TaxID=370355 RepID=A0A0A1TXU6_ENTIV|nr:zinc finger protein DHHC domain containing protein, putative [Entamoeba invadens IP1]ELP86184.1 zinc finger protein DHHC domain containing protein, putative [Entamoeba invadens IP1]|eukprot:XP_004185530.1 zinc finger protein DHHC domain containing protein, putative [Entamoeba invadens IP1]